MAKTYPTDEEPSGLRERGKKRRIDRILDAALELLHEDLGEKLTIDRIAARAEVAPMTVFNLVGNREQLWSAVADRVLERLDVQSIRADDPRQRAQAIVDAIVRILRSDPAVFRELLSRWSQSGRVLAHDPTAALVECLADAAAASQVTSAAEVRRHGEVLVAGLVGVIHQWGAGVLSDRAFAGRARAVVDVVFDSARI